MRDIAYVGLFDCLFVCLFVLDKYLVVFWLVFLKLNNVQYYNLFWDL